MANHDTKKSEGSKRLQLVLEHSKLSNLNVLARELGLKYGETLYQIARGNNRISKNMADRICTHYPQLSKIWLLTGQGDPYIETATSETATPKNESPQSVLPRTTPLTLYLDIDQANIVISQLQFWIKTNSEK